MFGLTYDRLDQGEESPLARSTQSAAVPAVLERGGRYGERKGFSPTAAGTVIAIHLALFSALILLRPDVLRKEEHRLKVIDVQLTPPPPPPAAKQETPHIKVDKIAPVVTVPPPLIQLATASIPAEISPDFKPPAAPPAPPPVAAPAPPAPPSVIQGGDIAAKVISGNPPRYPIESRRKREQGTVVLSLTVGTDGRVQAISLARSSGFARLDDAALKAVKSWRWSPIVRDGQPVIVRGEVRIPFVLQDSTAHRTGDNSESQG